MKPEVANKKNPQRAGSIPLWVLFLMRLVWAEGILAFMHHTR